MKACAAQSPDRHPFRPTASYTNSRDVTDEDRQQCTRRAAPRRAIAMRDERQRGSDGTARCLVWEPVALSGAPVTAGLGRAERRCGRCGPAAVAVRSRMETVARCTVTPVRSACVVSSG